MRSGVDVRTLPAWLEDGDRWLDWMNCECLPEEVDEGKCGHKFFVNTEEILERFPFLWDHMTDRERDMATRGVLSIPSKFSRIRNRYWRANGLVS